MPLSVSPPKITRSSSTGVSPSRKPSSPMRPPWAMAAIMLRKASLLPDISRPTSKPSCMPRAAIASARPEVRASTASDTPIFSAMLSRVGFTSVITTCRAPAWRTTAAARQPTGPAPVMSTSSPTRSNDSAVCTALSFDLVGEDVLITGAGPVGCLAAAVVRHAGARHVVITDVNPTRLSIAEKMGVSLAVDARTSGLAEAMAALGMQEGFDVGLEMSGSKDALRSMIAAMAHGGRIGLLGFLEGETPVELERVIFGGLTLKGIYGREMFETWYKMTAMVQGGLDVTPVITHHFPVAEYEEAFAIVRSGHSGKVILEWPAALGG